MDEHVLHSQKRNGDYPKFEIDKSFIDELDKLVEQNRKWWKRELYFMVYSQDDGSSYYDDGSKIHIIELCKKAFKSKTLLYNNNLYYVYDYSFPLNLKSAQWGYEFQKDAILFGLKIPRIIMAEIITWSETKKLKSFDIKYLPIYEDYDGYIVPYNSFIKHTRFNSTRNNCLIGYIKY